MASERLKEWVKQKKQEGVSDERIRKSLEETGHDPSIVDEVENPFGDDTSGEVSEDVFESSASGDSADDAGEQEDPGFSASSTREDQREEASTEEPESTGSGSQETGDDRFNYTSEEEEESTGLRDRLSFSVNRPSVSLPSLRKYFNPRLLAGILVLVLLVSGGYYLYSSGMYLEILSPGGVSGSSQEKLSTLDARHQGCPDAGVRINSVSSSNGETVANVLVTRNPANVVLIVERSGEMVGFTTSEIEGESSLTVDAVGDTAVLRPLGCNRFRSARSY